MQGSKNGSMNWLGCLRINGSPLIRLATGGDGLHRLRQRRSDESELRSREMDEIHIGIYVSGGVVQSTVANQKVTIHIIDEDNIESDGGDAEEIWCKAKSDYNMCPSKSVSDYHSFSEVDFE